MLIQMCVPSKARPWIELLPVKASTFHCCTTVPSETLIFEMMPLFWSPIQTNPSSGLNSATVNDAASHAGLPRRIRDGDIPRAEGGARVDRDDRADPRIAHDRPSNRR